MNGYQQRTERKKESIRQAAFELFKQYGADKVSVGAVAQKAGVSHVTIYKYFGSKDGLVSNIVKTQFMSVLQRLTEIVKSERPFAEKLEIILLDKVQAASNQYGELTRKAISVNPELRKFFESVLRNDMPQLYLAILDEGIKEGFVNSGISKDTALVYLYLLRAGAIADPESWAKLHSDEKSLRDFQNLVLYGLKGKED